MAGSPPPTPRCAGCTWTPTTTSRPRSPSRGALVAEAAAPFAALIARLQTIPGIGRRTAEVLVAETGGDMARFATAARLAAWAGLAPGGNQSAGKRKHAAARKGNRHLRVAMIEAAWATARTRTRPGARFRRLARRFGKGNEKKAAVAVARTLICIACAVLSRGEDYAEAGEDYYEQRDRRAREHLIRHHQQALARLGYQVTLIPPGDGSPPPSATSQHPPHKTTPSITGVPSIADSAGAAARQSRLTSFLTGLKMAVQGWLCWSSCRLSAR
jgi:hypothetical protein